MSWPIVPLHRAAAAEHGQIVGFHLAAFPVADLIRQGGGDGAAFFLLDGGHRHLQAGGGLGQLAFLIKFEGLLNGVLHLVGRRHRGVEQGQNHDPWEEAAEFHERHHSEIHRCVKREHGLFSTRVRRQAAAGKKESAAQKVHHLLRGGCAKPSFGKGAA